MLNFFRRKPELPAEVEIGIEIEMSRAVANPVTLVEYERSQSDHKQDELRAREISLEISIQAWQDELRQVRKVLKAEIIRQRELNADENYDPADDAAKSYDLAIADKRSKQRKPVLAAVVRA